VAALKWRRKYKRSVKIASQRQYRSPGAMPRKKSVAYFIGALSVRRPNVGLGNGRLSPRAGLSSLRGVERTKHSEAAASLF
ncbi:MAG: hypothetical protein IJZ19_04410, partial [Lentisphaeria bacterium]|nr:hypothetical protein [Lentisphaeria bacterium]